MGCQLYAWVAGILLFVIDFKQRASGWLAVGYLHIPFTVCSPAGLITTSHHPMISLSPLWLPTIRPDSKLNREDHCCSR